MNKELIKKYKAEFEHWLNGGKLLGRYNFTNIPNYKPEPWFELQDSKWFSKNQEYLEIIINDEYVELRKALAEGKTIQHISAITGEWVDFNKGFEPTYSYTFLATPEYYRIKPEEPKFKVGDWVIHNQKFKIVTKVVDGLIDCLDHSPAMVMRKDTLELWQPQPGEWCWFHNGAVESLYFYKFHSIISEGYIADIPKDIEHIMTAQIFKYCEPFTGNLPTIIKDN